MIETLTIITLSVLFLVFFRPGKTPPLNNPLVIDRPGRYHMTLAPQLNLAQPYIEDVVKLISAPNYRTEFSMTQYFLVQDKQVRAHGNENYLLAITLRNGMLYFQATSPKSDDQSSNQNLISESAASALERFPSSGLHNSALDECIIAAAQESAQLRNIHIQHLNQ
jgi:hypothetical protein